MSEEKRLKLEVSIFGRLNFLKIDLQIDLTSSPDCDPTFLEDGECTHLMMIVLDRIGERCAVEAIFNVNIGAHP